MPKITSELSWVLQDYRQQEIDPPARIVSHPHKTEGQMMSDDEIEEFIKDSMTTLKILSDKQSPRFDEIMDMYILDLAYLLSLGRITEDDYNDLTHPDNLRFHTL